MKYYSEKTKKFYDSDTDLFKDEKELEEREEKYRQKLAEQVKRGSEVDAAYDNYRALRDAYVKDYGTYIYASKDAGKDTEGSFIDGWFYNLFRL